MNKKALLALEDGTVFYGSSTANETIVCAEIVFNTAITGYQEVCTDPSYANQIVLFTMSHIGNVGTNKFDYESTRPWLKGIVVRELSKCTSNWRSEKDFVEFLRGHNIPWIEEIDTRKLTRHLREKGIQNACLMIGKIDKKNAVMQAKAHASLENYELFYEETKKNLENSNQIKIFYPYVKSKAKKNYKVILYDFGAKSNIFRILQNLNCDVRIVPSNYSFEKIAKLQPEGVVLSNGPGDPAVLKMVIENIRALIFSGIPTFGICFGCQLIGLAAGGQTIKMKFGHHGINHPVCDINTNHVFITSQNHNYVMDDRHLPFHLEITHRSLFDGSIQGIKLKGHPVVGFQGHPEGSPGPQDIYKLFRDFLSFLDRRRKDRALSESSHASR